MKRIGFLSALALALVLACAYASEEADLSGGGRHYGFKAPGEPTVTSLDAYTKSLQGNVPKAPKLKRLAAKVAKAKSGVAKKAAAAKGKAAAKKAAGAKAKVKMLKKSGASKRTIKKAKKKLKKAKKAAKKAGAKGGKANKASGRKTSLKKASSVKSLMRAASVKGKGLKNMSGTKAKGNCNTRLASVRTALKMCKNGITQITEKAKRSNQRLVKLAERRQQSKLARLDAKAKQHLKSSLRSQASRDNSKLRAKTQAYKARAKAKANQSGVARLASAQKDKAIAKTALRKAMQLSKGEKAQIRSARGLERKLHREKVLAAARKTERNAMAGKLKVANAATAATEAKLNKRLGKLESEDIHAAAAEKEAKRKSQDLMEEKTSMLIAARHMATGLHMKMQDIKKLKATLAKVTAKYHAAAGAHKRVLSEKKKGSDALNACNNAKAAALRTANAKYTKQLDKVKKKIQMTDTQSRLAKRALQLCENKSKGSKSRATNRVKRRTVRKVRRAKRAMHKKAQKQRMKKAVKAKLTRKIKKKLKKKEAKKVAKKFKKLTKKKLSPKCKACMKLTKAEKKHLGVDCKAC